MSECLLCESVENVDEHHVSYEPERTVPLCRSCHKEVHGADKHPLKPEDSPDESTIKLSAEVKTALSEYKNEGESYDRAVAKLLGMEKKTLWTKEEIEEIADKAAIEQILKSTE